MVDSGTFSVPSGVPGVISGSCAGVPSGVISGVGCGVLTVLLRYFGSYPEGVSYAILIMNCCVGFFDKIGVPKRFGVVQEGGKKR